MRDRARTFDDEQIMILQHAVRSDPTNIAAANEYWSALGNWNGFDSRCGWLLIQAYREAALHSCDGALALAFAYYELFSISGEAPRSALFDRELISALSRCDDGRPERSTIRWVLESAS